MITIQNKLPIHRSTCAMKITFVIFCEQSHFIIFCFWKYGNYLAKKGERKEKDVSTFNQIAEPCLHLNFLHPGSKVKSIEFKWHHVCKIVRQIIKNTIQWKWKRGKNNAMKWSNKPWNGVRCAFGWTFWHFADFV